MNLSMALVGKLEGIFLEFRDRPIPKNNRGRKRGGELDRKRKPQCRSGF